MYFFGSLIIDYNIKAFVIEQCIYNLSSTTLFCHKNIYSYILHNLCDDLVTNNTQETSHQQNKLPKYKDADKMKY